VKFEISLQGLSVKFEGDIQTAERMQNQITGALNSLTSAQNKLLAPGQSPTVASSVEVVPSRRRRRRSKKVDGIDPSILDANDLVPEGRSEGESSDGDGNRSSARRPPRSGATQTELLARLKSDGFFAERRTIGDIRAALSRKGHSFKSNELSPILVALTKKEVLQCEQNAEGQWIYYAG